MINNNKILTVSYGTFSCTLEGFDDSFGTMKAIAEYFRDLAADDRYFGAEPPQPDADMLARIAQKEISRRVEAHERDGKIVLSAHSDDVPATQTAPVAALSAASADAPAVAESLLQDGQDEAYESESAPLVETPAEIHEAHATTEADTAVTNELSRNLAPEAEEIAQGDEGGNQDNVQPETEKAVQDLVAEKDETDADIQDQTAAEDAADHQVDEDVIQDVEIVASDAAIEAEAEAEAEVDETADAIASFKADTSEDTDSDDLQAEAPADEQHREDAAADPMIADPDIADAAAYDADDLAEGKAAETENADVLETAQDETLEGEIDIVPGQSDDAIEAFFANSPSQDIATDEDDYEQTDDLTLADMQGDAESFAELEADAADTKPAGALDSIAAKLQRIRAVVSQQRSSGDTAEYEEDAMEEMPSDAEFSDANSIIADTRHDIEEALSADDEMELADADAEENDEDDVSSILSRLDAAEAREAAEADEYEEMQEDVAEEAEADESFTNLFEAEMEEVEDAVAEADDQSGMGSHADASDSETDDAATQRARVIKVKRADLEAAIAKGELEEYDDAERDVEMSADADVDLAEVEADAEDQDAAPDHASSLSPEDESELARELAAVVGDAAEENAKTAELVEDSDAAEDEAETASETAPSRHSLPSLDDDQGEDVNRLMAETEQQMDEPESATRRDAFAHLRAAVAARKADEAMGTAEDDADSDDAYRSDLADVVKPRRPVSGAGRTDRPTAERPAPLKLVAEQRVDADRPKAEGPVRPRRVAAATDAEQGSEDAGSFADYATDMGATSLPQLLEAAAAYMSFVEGRPQFSRPQLMNKVRQVEMEEFSREDGLRSFGQLLRAGKIEKIKGGRFTVSEDIGYHPDHRAAG